MAFRSLSWRAMRFESLKLWMSQASAVPCGGNAGLLPGPPSETDVPLSLQAKAFLGRPGLGERVLLSLRPGASAYLNNPPQLARLLICRLPGLGKQFFVFAGEATHQHKLRRVRRL